MNISSWAGCCRTPPKSTKITRKHRLQFLSRMLQRQKRQKSPSFIVKTPVKSIAEHRKVRELPRKMNIEEVEAPKKHENLQTKPVLDPFKSTADTRKVRELPRKMNIEEVEEPETMKIYRQNPKCYHTVWGKKYVSCLFLLLFKMSTERDISILFNSKFKEIVRTFRR